MVVGEAMTQRAPGGRDEPAGRAEVVVSQRGAEAIEETGELEGRRAVTGAKEEISALGKERRAPIGLERTNADLVALEVQVDHDEVRASRVCDGACGDEVVEADDDEEAVGIEASDGAARVAHEEAAVGWIGVAE